jgi:hypothetical protein
MKKVSKLSIKRSYFNDPVIIQDGTTSLQCLSERIEKLEKFIMGEKYPNSEIFRRVYADDIIEETDEWIKVRKK